jgi:hypothetical protein
MDRFMKKIDDLYDFTYASKYGPDWIYSFLIFFIAFLIVLYCQLQEKKEDLASNWNEVRCEPQNMALAGLINPPEDGSMSSTEYTKNNFQGCLNDMAKKTSEFKTAPMLSNLNSLADNWGSFYDSLNSMRDYFSQFRDNFAGFIENIMGQIMNMFIEFQRLFVSIRDLVNKIIGILTSALMATLGLYYTLVSSFKALYNLMLAITITATALAIVAMFSIIGIPIGIILFIFVGVLIYMMVQMATGLPSVTGIRFPRAPGARKPRVCFDKNTKLVMSNPKIEKNISEIKLNDTLRGNNTVYGIFKMSADNEKGNMYKLNDIIVSGDHKVKYLGEWINVKDCEKSTKIKYHDKIIYNLLTFSKNINIKNMDFLDYDDITPDNLDKLNKSVVINKDSLHKNFGLFRKFIGGFYGDTKIRLIDKTVKEIKNIKVNDILDDNIKVVGVVELDCSDVKIKMVNTVPLMCTPNILHDSLGQTKTIHSVRGQNLGELKCNKVYHLITDKNYFYIGYLKIYDYDYLIDHYLE